MNSTVCSTNKTCSPDCGRNGVNQTSRVGLSLVQHGHWQQAQDTFFKGIQLATAGQAPGVSKTEMCLWETQWLNAAKQLNQWDLISDFSRTVEHSELMVQSLWRWASGPR